VSNRIPQIVALFDKIEAIQDAPSDALQYDFNVFSILRRANDEVNLHSRFIHDLLDPKGLHGQGDIFLQLFLQQIGILNFDTRNTKAKREYKNIDIFVANDHTAIIIENKIHADDQDLQLERYYQLVSDGFDQVHVVYLTLYGDRPTSHSLGSLDPEEITTASYKDDIHMWLENCVGNVKTPIVRETIRQYKWLIEELTGQSLWKGYEYLMSIKELLMTRENLELAIDVSQALVEAKIDIQFGFWQDLERELIRRGYEIDDYWKYTRSKVEKYYKKDTRYYGLYIPLYRIEETDQLYFIIAIGQGIYYGLRSLRNGRMMKNAREPRFDYWANWLRGLEGNWRRSDWLIGLRTPNRKLSFSSFNDENVLSLVDPAKRKKCASDLADEVSNVISRFQTEYLRQETA
jgi:hypothetical protein